MKISENLKMLMSVDLEDWFQVENLKEYIPYSSWPSYQLRVEKNTYKILDILDKCPSTLDETGKKASNIKVTFFVLGWIAKRLPHLIREIKERGHEIASHGYSHNIYTKQSLEEFKKDSIDSKKLLEDIIGDKVIGYRAPSFSINNVTLKIIEECGYIYDSSYNSFSLNSRYGHLDLPIDNKHGIAFKISKNFYEIPISNIKIAGKIIPWGGGGYFRLTPFFIFKIGVQLRLKRAGGYMFYVHPWEIDPEQPRINIPILFKFRHYVNLGKTQIKLIKFLETFKECDFITCSQYINYLNELST